MTTVAALRLRGICRSMMTGCLSGMLGSAWSMSSAQSAAGPVDVAAATHAFTTADRLCHLDAGRFWGVSLCGPMLVVDPDTRAYLAFA